MNTALDWERDGADWPHREYSQFVEAGGITFHVQLAGAADAPPLLLVHGTGAASHTWRGMLPLLARTFRVIAPDLPGHAFSEPLPPRDMTLNGLAAALSALLTRLGLAPALAVGHSAGAALLARMAIDRRITPRSLISLNGALLPLPGLVGHFFSPMAKLLAVNPFAPRLVAWRAMDPSAVGRLIAGTGSTLDETGTALYARLVRSPGHVRAVLNMLAGWDLKTLERDLPGLDVSTLLVIGEQDRTVPPDEAVRAAKLIRHARVLRMARAGHLLHEEHPEETVRIIESQYRRGAAHDVRQPARAAAS
ncbi:MAG: alpha/beta fold hydrolase [Burkholderiales bacterium]|nr:alpha/beta fold hydrolase [Burkholderiales bacterium]